MNILIIGCGRLGARLANVLDEQDHDISIIGRDASMFDLLNDKFSGLSIRGNPIDSDVMKSAGIEGCDFIVCVTESDNANIMAAQIASKFFGKEKIIARVLDPVKSNVYEHLGISTVCPTSLAFEAICSAVFHADSNRVIRCGRSYLEITIVPYEKWMKGKSLEKVEYLSNHKLIGLMDDDDHLILYDRKLNREIEQSDKLAFANILQ